MNKEIFKEKIEQAVKILNEKNIDMWMIFVRESSTIHDPSLDIVVGGNWTWQSAFIFSRDGETAAIVGSLEEDNIKRIGTFKNIITYVKSIREPLNEYLSKKNPSKIAVNYSKNSVLADGITHGMYNILREHLISPS